MKKTIYQSKTVWGIVVVGLVALATQTGIVEPSVVTNVLTTLGAALGAYGIRDAL